MDRLRVATLLAVVASLVVPGTAVVAAAAYLRQDDAARAPAGPAPGASATGNPETLLVRHPRTGSTFEVPDDGTWRVEDRRVRIYYADRRGRPTAVVHGPAVFRQGYCSARPRGSNRAFAGFTRETFATWVGALAPGDGGAGGWRTGVDRRRVELADGTRARLVRVALLLTGRGPCTASGVEVAMVQAGGVRVVLVRDAGDPGTLADHDVDRILTSLTLK